MNKLEEQIWDRYGNFELSHDKNKLIVDHINNFVEKHCIEFAEWIRIKDFQTTSKDNWIGLDMKYYTTKELFEQYKTEIDNL